MSYRVIAAIGYLLALAAPALAQQNDPWEVKRTPFGRTAVGYTKVAANASANVLAVGLYCGRTQPRLYLYGLSHDRMANGKPVIATITVDGHAEQLSLGHDHDAVVTQVSRAFVHEFVRAKTVTIAVKDYDPPSTDTLNMEKAAAAISDALLICLKL